MKKITALLLVLMMLVSVLTACGDTKDKDSEKQDETTAATVEKDEGKDDGKAEDKDDEKKPEKAGVLPEKLTATKIGSLDIDYIYSVNEWGILYRDENDMLGTMTLDGKTGSGAKWIDCQNVSSDGYGYYAVTTKASDQMDSIENLNCYGIANAKGELLIPEKYASFDLLSERYVRVYEVTEKADGKDDALVYMAVNNSWSIFPDEDDVYLRGNWYVYDLEAGALVDGVSGTKPYYVYARGDVIEYYDDNSDTHYVDANGKEWEYEWFIDEERGVYGVEDKDKGETTVYTQDGKKIFSFDSEKYDIYSYGLYGEYYRVSENKDGKTINYLMDDSGKIVSAGFEKLDKVIGDFIVSGDIGLCDFEGNVIFSTEDYMMSITEDRLYGALYVFSADDKEYVMNTSGEVILSDEDIITSYDGVITKDSAVYCIKDNDFTLAGNEVGPFLVEKIQDNDSSATTRKAVDVISGETIVEGYKDYEASDVVCLEDGTFCYYVYAEKIDGGFDVYEIK